MKEKIDLSKKAIEMWNTFDTDQKSFWSDYFELQTVSIEDINKFSSYSHEYLYSLNNEEITKVVFCIVVEILRYNDMHKMNRAFFGNSGGLDSATVCALLSKAKKMAKDLGNDFDIISLGLPIYSNPEHDMRAKQTAQKFEISHVLIENLDNVLKECKKSLSPLVEDFNFNEEEVRRGFGNVKARMRMIVNFFGTTQPGSYVVSTDNLSELYMAFWTLMGDVGAFGPIQNIFKGLELPSIAFALGVPEETLGAKPTDGLEIHASLDEREGGDVDAFKGVQYPHLDAIICYAVKNGLMLDKDTFVTVPAGNIDSDFATQEVVDGLVRQMSSPGSVWKRKSGSIGTAICREDLGLSPLENITLV
ncbi:MAG: NAD(+) synthase [Candidatus Magasanikbacteria bacterium CG_4_9_14_0_2_um_filter_41_10]|uniref:NH(3)-dependent NAD(+) synthetase n=1 Tax=Candidatus Magasanikbacteria bacterium CG_4_10_14_0_2_um_filter_41_31 TaxID=1974639 RepID=A0A2M7V229_9BACT|nr:MAG: NAD(+) synthase [Candidatus Magasanikbacteria bacterium CG1_02_41_34]PIZ92457.1 MAG: NAD(+) synthase [Candidatus Magasanikbacteria bacterium CG_4_10_14_0_2_um_filter_41_31]PJC53834.1 MAG: NAD(+) synthase [Candidatus Magasanikbacteria bacterium CG_4_9_14_0_2_um_filter_41_10]